MRMRSDTGQSFSSARSSPANARDSPPLLPVRTRSPSPRRVKKRPAQAQMYTYLYGWEEYLRRAQERKSTIVLKKAPGEPGEMPFRAGRSRQRPHRFLKANTKPEEMGWRQLLGCGDPLDPLGSCKRLMHELSAARAAAESAQPCFEDVIATSGYSGGIHTQNTSNTTNEANARARSPAIENWSLNRYTSLPDCAPATVDLRKLKQKEIELFELSQMQENLVRLPRPVQRMGLGTPIRPSRNGRQTSFF